MLLVFLIAASWDSIVIIPNRSYHGQASTVHDNRRSKNPKTPQVWKSYPPAMPSVVVHLFFFSCCDSRCCRFLRWLFITCYSLFLIDIYWVIARFVWFSMGYCKICLGSIGLLQDLFEHVCQSGLDSRVYHGHHDEHRRVAWWFMAAWCGDSDVARMLIEGHVWSWFMTLWLPELIPDLYLFVIWSDLKGTFN